MKRSSGFTLLELSIVLVIIGLIVGGITVGSSMIRAAELRSIMTDVNKYKTTFHTFKDKYFHIPGDMPNATSFWGKDNALCAAHTGTAATNGTCNGDGDGEMGGTSEAWYAWHQLGRAGMIEGSPEIYNSGDLVVGQHVPTTAFPNAGFRFNNYGTNSGATWWFDGTYNNIMRFGRPNNPGCPTCFNAPSDFSAEDAWSMDKKMDDGKPGTGFMRASKPSATVIATSCVDSATASAYGTANYQLDSEESQCLALFLLGI